MSTASYWQGAAGSIPLVNALGNIQEQWFTAVATQNIFVLTDFTYAPGTKSVFVYVNGVMQQRSVNYTETSPNTITLTSNLDAGDKVCIIAYAIYGVLTS
jgi:hypothetical protein